MNREEHLLTCLQEECIEVGKELSKAKRFGLEDEYSDTSGTNREKIVEEMCDLLGAYRACFLEGLVPDLGLGDLPVFVQEKMIAKGHKIEKYIEYANRVGKLHEH